MSTLKLLLLCSLLAISFVVHAEPVGTAFTYQGELQQSGSPANGGFDFQFELFDADSDGSSITAAIQLENVLVSDGVFTVDLDFGDSPYIDQKIWLEIGVRDGLSNGAFTALTPRQAINPTPLALYALSGNEGPVGPQGLKGDTGLTGPQGLKGDTGPQSLKGDTGDTGPQGLKGDTGDTGPQGLKGDIGDTGPQYRISGRVSGLSGSGLLLQNNGGDDLAVFGNGSFTFARGLVIGSDYEVTVLTPPSNPIQTCSVTNGIGTLAGEDVTDVIVTCVTLDEIIFSDGFE